MKADTPKFVVSYILVLTKTEAKANSEADWRWLLPLIPVLVVSVIATGIVSLMQSALPLDMVRGGLARAPLSETSSGGLIAWQLLLLMVLQWPIGNWVAKRSLRFGLGMGLLGFITGCLLLAGSALWSGGSSLIALAMVPIAFGRRLFYLLRQRPWWKRHHCNIAV